MSTFDSRITQQIENLMNDTIDLQEERRATNARRRLNYDRAIQIVARLVHEGAIDMLPGAADNAVTFENSIDAVFDMLERFRLDSPNGDFVHLFANGRGDDEL